MQGGIQTWGNTGGDTDMGNYRGVYRHGEIQGGIQTWGNTGGIQALGKQGDTGIGKYRGDR